MRRTSWVTAVAAVMVMVSSCGAGGAGGLPSLPPLPSQEYRLGSGDKIRLSVYGLDAMNAEYTVGDSGFLSLPLIQGVPVSGLTLREVEQAIAAKLSQQQILREPVVNVQTIALRPFYILGEVRNPGEYPYRPGMTVQSAVATAGGFTYRAANRSVAVTRLVNGQEIVGAAPLNAPVMPGDRIRVFEKWF
jgi:protein involved in polysaccharide export with SLBB domain